MKNIKNQLYNIFLINFAILIILINIYLRVFRSREILTLDSLKTNLTTYFFIVLFYFCIIHFMIIILTVYALYKKYNNIKNNSYILLKINAIIYWLPFRTFA